MNANLAAVLYLVAGVLFIMSLRGLSSPASSRQGNFFGMIGMAIAVGTTLAAHPPAAEVDLPSLADQVFAAFEGGFILARALQDPTHLQAQLAHLRHYLALLFRLPV